MAKKEENETAKDVAPEEKEEKTEVKEEPEKEEKKAPKEKKEERPAEPKPEKEAKVDEEKKEEPKSDAERLVQNIKFPPIFGKYELSEVIVSDRGLARYMNLNPTIVLHSDAKYANKPFGKARINLVERLVNNLMRTEDFTGKKSKSYDATKKAFEILEKRAKKNPIQVYVEAVQMAAPKEEITRLRFGGISVPKAVDISPSRRLDIAIRNICKGAVQSTYKNKKSISECLANEILLASKGDMNSFAVSKKEEVERVAASAR